MKIAKFQEICSNQEIRDIVFPPGEENRSKTDILESLLGIPDAARRDLLMSTLFDNLKANIEHPQSKKQLRGSLKLMKAIKKLLLESKSAPTVSAECLKKATDLLQSNTPLPSQPLAAYQIPLSELLHTRDQLAEDNEKGARALLLDLKAITPRAPSPRTRSEALRQDTEHPFLYGSEAFLPDQSYILAARPASISDLTKYVEQCLMRNVRVMVSLHETTERPEKVHVMNPETLSQVGLTQGGTIQIQSQVIRETGTVLNKHGVMPKIIETRLTITYPDKPPQEIYHLHYDGWMDYHKAPDEALLQKLFNRMKELSPDPKTPIAVNCNAGFGRTGVVACAFMAERQMDKAQDSLSSFTINLPAILLSLRQFREHLLGGDSQYLQLYSLVHQYFCHVQSQLPKEPAIREAPAPASLSMPVELSHLEETYVRLAANDYQEASSIMTRLKLQSEAASVQRALEGKPPEECAIGHFAPMPEQTFIITALPRGEKVNTYFQTALQKNASVLVSVHETKKNESDTNDRLFWPQDAEHPLRLSDGTVIEFVQSQIRPGTEPNLAGMIPTLTETTLKATLPDATVRMMTHLHFDGWIDHKPAPDEGLFGELLTRMQHLSQDPRTPIFVNCDGGYGRSPTVAISYIARKQIQKAKREQEASLDQFQIDIAKILLDFRRFRPKAMNNPRHFTQVHHLAFSYYQAVKAQVE